MEKDIPENSPWREFYLKYGRQGILFRHSCCNETWFQVYSTGLLASWLWYTSWLCVMWAMKVSNLGWSNESCGLINNYFFSGLAIRWRFVGASSNTVADSRIVCFGCNVFTFIQPPFRLYCILLLSTFQLIIWLPVKRACDPSLEIKGRVFSLVTSLDTGHDRWLGNNDALRIISHLLLTQMTNPQWQYESHIIKLGFH